MPSLRVMTQNMANYDDHASWEARLALLSRTVQEARPDVLALQEIRYDPGQPSTRRTLQHMGEQLLASLRAFDPAAWSAATLVVHPATFYEEDEAAQVWEGVGVVSRLPVLSTGAKTLSRDPSDENRRLTERLLLDAGGGRRLWLLNTHLTLGSARAEQVADTLAMLPEGPAPAVVVGDMNADAGDASLGGFLKAGLLDAWAAARPGVPGPTWDLTRASGPTKRLDQCWVSREVRVADARVVGERKVDGLTASDHAGLVVDVTI